MSKVTSSPYGILRKPLLTEKTTVTGAVVFEVHPRATKNEIKNAVQTAFGVEVSRVRTINNLGKIKKVANKIGRKKNWKKAYVTLKEGNSIDLIEGF